LATILHFALLGGMSFTFLGGAAIFAILPFCPTKMASYHLLPYFCHFPPSQCFRSPYFSLAQVSCNQGHHWILPIHSGLDCYAQGS
jgi:hypothetical protein